jgi:membrane protease YdiL (CAAX protease family)
MTIAHGELPAESTTTPVPTVATPESAVRLIVVAFGWILLAMIPSALVGLAKGFATGFVRGLTKGASELQIPPTWSQLLTMLGALGFALIILYASSVRGRIVGGGDVRIGLGLTPIAKLPVVIILCLVLALYAGSIVFSVYVYRHDLFFQSSSTSPWLIVFDSLVLIIFAPLAEELFFRGWLWTGLNKQWHALPTALLTATMWLALHLERGIGYVVLLLFPALIITLIRQAGKSARATICAHVIYNLAANIPLIALVIRLFQN